MKKEQRLQEQELKRQQDAEKKAQLAREKEEKKKEREDAKKAKERQKHEREEQYQQQQREREKEKEERDREQREQGDHNNSNNNNQTRSLPDDDDDEGSLSSTPARKKSRPNSSRDDDEDYDDQAGPSAAALSPVTPLAHSYSHHGIDDRPTPMDTTYAHPSDSYFPPHAQHEQHPPPVSDAARDHPTLFQDTNLLTPVDRAYIIAFLEGHPGKAGLFAGASFLFWTRNTFS